MPGLRHIAFRVDASVRVGIGHVMRCLCLADELRERGFITHFVSRQMAESLRIRVLSAGHELHLLPAPTTLEPEEAWTGAVQSKDASESWDSLGAPLDIMVVDHYSLGSEWESRIVERGARVVSIDDLGREHICDVLLDQNLYADGARRYARRVPSSSKILVGPAYALLRTEFSRLRRSPNMRSSDGCRIFVLFGGGDALDLTSRALAAIEQVNRPDVSVDVVIGPENPHREFLTAKCARRAYACHVDSDRVAELMAMASLAIGASGSASWERCCVGLPSITVATANNQLQIGESLERAGVVMHLGSAEEATTTRIASAVRDLVRDRPKLRAMSERAVRLVDGRGCGRVADVIGAVA